MLYVMKKEDHANNKFKSFKVYQTYHLHVLKYMLKFFMNPASEND